MSGLMNVLRATGRGLGKLPRLIGDTMTEQYDPYGAMTPPFNPNAAGPLSGAGVPPGMDVQAPAPQPQRRMRPMVGDLFNAAIDGVAVPNVAMGGATDVARAMQAGREGRRERQFQDMGVGMQQQRMANDIALMPLRQMEIEQRIEAEKARKAASDATAERQRMLGGRSEQRYLNTPHGVFDVEAESFVDNPNKKELMRDGISAEFAKAVGWPIPEGATSVSVPDSVYQKGLPGYQSGKRQPAAVQAKDNDIRRYAEGLMEQNPQMSEQDAFSQALIWNQQRLQTPVTLTEARTGQVSASTGSIGATTENTRTRTDETQRERRINEMANRAISGDTSGTLENAIKNVKNLKFYQGWTAQDRADVEAEIKKRLNQQRKPVGGPGGFDAFRPGATRPVPAAAAPVSNDPLGVR